MEAKPRVLFVDDEPRILEAMRRMLWSRRHDWTICLANSGQEALALLADSPCDLVVSDIRMPGMTGVEFLDAIRQRHPGTIRIALSGQASRTTLLHAVGPTHQYIPKPCDAGMLRSVVDRVMALRSTLPPVEMRRLIGGVSTVGSPPAVVHRLQELLAQEHVDLDQVAEVIATDVGMSAKVLQMVSSGFFGAAHWVRSAADAVRYLGSSVIQVLVAHGSFASPLPPGVAELLELEQLSRRARTTSILARRICKQLTADPKAADAAFMGGMLHEVGRIVLAQELPARYAPLSQQSDGGSPEAERATFGATCTDAGGYLLGIWGLSQDTVDAVLGYRETAEAGENEPAPRIAVRLARSLLEEVGVTASVGAACPQPAACAHGTGLEQHLPLWRQWATETVDKE